MPSSKDYLQFIAEQLSDLEEITYRAMMGDYIMILRLRAECPDNCLYTFKNIGRNQYEFNERKNAYGRALFAGG